MPFVRPTISEITTRIEKGIESRLFGTVALLRRAILRILARAFAGAIHTNYGHVDWVKDQLFTTTAEEEFLTRKGKEWGVPRRAGSFAVGEVQFEGLSGTVIPKDTRIQTEEGIEYGTLSEITIPGGGFETVYIQSIEATDDANKEWGVDPYYFQLIEPIDDVETEVLLTASVEGGADAEDIEEWRARILQRIQAPPMGGTADDYVRWALEVDGVGRAWCYPLANGPGTVAVAIISNDPNNPAPSSGLIADVAAYMEDKKPVTAGLQVVSTTDRYGTDGVSMVYMAVNISPNNTDIRNAITENIKSLFLPHKPGDTIKISQIRSAISTSGVTDYVIDGIYIDTEYEGNDQDIALTGYMYPVLDYIGFGDL